MRYALFSLMIALVITPLAFSDQHNPHLPEKSTNVKKAEAFIDLLAAGEYEKAVADFDATMTRVMPASKTREVWEQVLKQVGTFKSRLSVRAESAGIYDIILVTCQFAKTKLDVKVVFDPQQKIAGLFFVPSQPEAEYRPPGYSDFSAYQEEEVEFGLQGWRLPATLTLPKGNGPFPALVLVHGSGPNDRDESIGPNKPFKDLALGLASRGISVLRYDKRTKAHNSKFLDPKARFTIKEETVEDAGLAAAFLMQRPEIDSQRVFVLGHSLGGMMIPQIAEECHEVAGFISLAGATRPLEEMIVEQYAYIHDLDGRVTDKEKAEMDNLISQVDRIKSLKKADIETDRTAILGAFPEYYLDLREYNPTEKAKSITRPFLILQGGRDYQVTESDLANWKKALKGKDNVVFKLYPSLNHLFISGSGTITPAEYQKPGHVAQEVIADIAAFIFNLQMR